MTETDPRPITHEQLLGLAEEYASAVIARQALVAAVRRRLAEVADEMRPALVEASAAEVDAQAALLSAVDAAPELFAKPRTRTHRGIKYGWQTGKASISIPDPAETLRRIKQLPEGQQELLIRRTEAIHKPGLLDLDARSLTRLRVVQELGEDTPIAKVVKDETDRLVTTLLSETVADTAAEQEAA